MRERRRRCRCAALLRATRVDAADARRYFAALPY